MEQQELNLANAIVEAFDEMDSKKIVTILNHPFVKTMDNEYAKLARDLAVKHGGGSSDQTSQPAENELQAQMDDEASALL